MKIITITLTLLLAFSNIYANKKRRRVIRVPQKQVVTNNRPTSELARKIKPISKTFQSDIPDSIKVKWNNEKISIHFKETPINDFVQSLNSLYGVNVAVAKEIDTKVTLHLDEIGIVEALSVLCKTNRLSIKYSSGVFYLNPISEETRNLMEADRGRMDLDVQNQEIKLFVREFSAKTGLKILASKDLKGTVTGSWKSVKPLEGFKALMEAHNYKVKYKNDFYIVQNQLEENEGKNNRRSLRRRTGGRKDISVINNRVTLNLVNANLQEVLIELSEEADLNTIFYGEFNENINARLENVNYDEAFSSLLRGTPYTYLLNENGTLLVGKKDPKTESGKILSTYELYRLNHVKAEDVFKVLPASINKGLLTVIKEQNAVLISGTRVEIENIKAYLKSVDLEIPQVVLECTIVELTRSSGDEYGIKNNNSTENPKYSNPSIQSYFTYSGDELYNYDRNNVFGQIGIFPAGFKLELSALESSNKAKVLAMPKITTLNGNKSSIRVTNTISLVEQAVGPNETPILQYKEFKDGITLNITPFISNGGEITLEIKPEIRTSSASANGVPAISERSLETTVKLTDSETIMLGGLIQSNKKKEKQGVPLLGSIPILGALFSYYKEIETTTELVIFVTPHLLTNNSKKLNLSDEVKRVESRKEFDDFESQVIETKFQLLESDSLKEIPAVKNDQEQNNQESLIKSKTDHPKENKLKEVNSKLPKVEEKKEDKVVSKSKPGMIKHPDAL